MALMASAGNVVRSAVHGLFVFVLSVTTFIGIILIAISLPLTDKDTVKSLPQRAGVYDDITEAFLSLVQQGDREETTQDEQGLNALLKSDTLNTTAIQGTIESVYPPSYWQSKFEGVTDDVYAWLEGEAESLQFEINFNDNKDELASELTDEIANQMAGLSTCSPAQIRPTFDVLSAECLPPGVTAEQAANTFERELTGPDGALDQDLRIDQDDLDMTAETQSNVLRTYSTLQNVPLFVGLVVLIALLLVVITGRTWINGLRKAGLTMFGAGLVSWISFFLLGQLGDFSPKLGDNEAERLITERVMTPLIQTITNDLASAGMWTAIAVVIIGGILWLSAYTLHKVHHHSEAEKIAARSMGGQDKSGSKQPSDKLPPPVDPNQKS